MRWWGDEAGSFSTASWGNSKLCNGNDKTTEVPRCWQNQKLTKWQVDKMARRWYGELMKWEFDEIKS